MGGKELSVNIIRTSFHAGKMVYNDCTGMTAGRGSGRSGAAIEMCEWDGKGEHHVTLFQEQRNF